MSELGNLSQCMVDSDAASKIRAKRLRRKALALSILVEAIAIGALVIWPLLTVAVLPSHAVVTPLPPYPGMPQPERPLHPTTHPGSFRPNFGVRPVFQPPTIPTRADTSGDPELPNVGTEGPAVTGVAGGLGDVIPIQIVRPPQPPPPTRTVLRPAQVMEAMLVRRVQPDYPWLAKQLRRSGAVILRATIGTDGQIRNLEVLSGDALLAQAAKEAVMQWRYRPTTLNGQPVEVETQVTVNFILN